MTSSSQPNDAQRPAVPWWRRVLIGRRPRVTLVRLIILIAVIVPTAKWCFTPIRVSGHSMEPTYRNGRLNLLNLLAYYNQRQPQRGDVVAIRMTGRRMTLLKRILGLPGERIRLKEGTVLVNGTPMDEPYARGRDLPPITNDVTLGSDSYFVIGDNRDVSEYGVVRRSEIKGKVLF